MKRIWVCGMGGIYYAASGIPSGSDKKKEKQRWFSCVCLCVCVWKNCASPPKKGTQEEEIIRQYEGH